MTDNHPRLRQNSQPPAHWASRWLFLVLLLELAVVITREALGAEAKATWWLDAGALATATVVTLVAMLRELPVQNVLFVALVLSGCGGILWVSGGWFMPLIASAQPDGDTTSFDHAAWLIPIALVLTISNARLLAKHLLAPRRHEEYYGIKLTALASVLACLFQISIFVFGANVRDYWQWQVGALAWFYCGLWLGLSAIVLVVLVPWFISKKPGGPQSTGTAPGVWFALHTTMLLVSMGKGRWLTAAWITVMGLVLPALVFIMTQSTISAQVHKDR